MYCVWLYYSTQADTHFHQAKRQENLYPTIQILYNINVEDTDEWEKMFSSANGSNHSECDIAP